VAVLCGGFLELAQTIDLSVAVNRTVKYKGKVDMIGQLLAKRYQIIRVLAAGAFGQTYVARDTHIPGNPTCVVKHLKPASNSPKLLATARQLFKREAETLVKLGNHDQIPQLFAYFEEDDEFYLVQEYIEGHTLSAELPPGQRLPESQVIQLLQEILNILDFVHCQGVIHRDIKPDNIIRRELDNRLVLIDFGAIKQVQSQHLTPEGQVQTAIASTRIGTPGYTPTEQDRGKSRPSSDIYALGMVGIQALTGIYPHHLQEDEETGEVIWQHQAQVSSELAAILTKMVRYHFKDRYQSAEEALLALEQLTSSSAISTPTATVVRATPPSVHELLLRWVEGGKIVARAIHEKQRSKNPGTVRIGSDATLCDIVLSEPTVSGLHAEIFFHPLEKRFYLRSLQQSNPPVVDGQPLTNGERVLLQGSCVELGQIELKVLAIDIQPLTPAREDQSTRTLGQQVNTLLQPSIPTVQQPRRQAVKPKISTSSFSHQTLPRVQSHTAYSASSSGNGLLLLVRLGVAALVTVGVGYAYLQNRLGFLGLKYTSTAKSNSTSESNTTNSSTAKSGSKTNSDKISKAIAKPESTVNLLRTDTAIAKPESTASSAKAGTATTKPESTASLAKTDTSSIKFDPTPSLDGTDTSSVKFDPTPSLDGTDPLSVTSDSTVKSGRTGTSRTQSRSMTQSGRTGTSRTKPDSTKANFDNGLTLLENARRKAKRGDVPGAIALAEDIPFESSLYQQAQYEITQWQRQQQQKLARQEAENQARKLLADATQTARRGESGDIETAIKLAEEALTQAPPGSAVFKEAKNAIAKWQKEAAAQSEQQTKPLSNEVTVKPEQPTQGLFFFQEATAQLQQQTRPLSYACYCQPTTANAQTPVAYTESGMDWTGLGCTIDEAPTARIMGAWNCNKL
jgi:eukaryotic-like serine/threonine-protein kinase